MRKIGLLFLVCLMLLFGDCSVEYVFKEDSNEKFNIFYFKTDLNFDYVVDEQMREGNCFIEDDGWRYCSKSEVEYYLNPNNFLNEKDIFQFKVLTFDEKINYLDGVEKIFKDTFMESKENDILYSTIVFESCKKYNVDPYFIAARLVQEQGVKGESNLISGLYGGYEGYYNYFNIGASGDNVVKNGLERAKLYEWSSVEKSIEGGIKWIKDNYLDNGQDTIYLQKFDVEKEHKGICWHQYMQNVEAAYEEGVRMSKVYRDVNYELLFKIPIYKNI